MASQRLFRILTEREKANGDQVFGETQLLPPDGQLNLAPVKRVALIAEAFLPKVDGVTKTAYLTLRYLQQTGREVLVFAPDIAVPSVGPSEVIALPSLGTSLAPESRLALPTPYVAQKLDEFQPDLIQMFSPAAMSVNGMAMGRHLDIPVIANYQTDLPGYSVQYGFSLLSSPIRRWLRYIHNGCHLTLVPSRTVKAELQEFGFRRMRIWGRGVNTDRFTPTNYRDEMRHRLLNGRDPAALLCIYVGRLANEKRIDLLLEVAKQPGVALTIIGDGAKREELEALFAETDTFFTGYLFGADLAQAFASSDVFTFTGPNETFGQVVQEAMASGLPCVVTDQGSVKDLINEGETGYICNPTPESFARAVIKLRDNPDLRCKMAHRVREITEKRPWWEIMRQLEGYYAEAIHINERFRRVFGHTTYHVPLPISPRWPTDF